MRNCIVIKCNDQNKVYATVIKDGETRYITKEKNLLDLIHIAKKYGYLIRNEIRIVKNAREIIKEYEEHIKNRKKLEVHGKIEPDMKLTKKNKGKGKRILASFLTGVVLLGSGAVFASTNNSANTDNKQEGQYITIQTDPPYETTPSTNSTEETTAEKETEPTTEKGKEQQKEKKKKSKEKKKQDKDELNAMFSNEQFHFSYENRMDNGNLDVVNQYDDLFQKFGKKYGVDPDMLKAIAAQESGGENILDGPAAGIMQIEKSVHVGQTTKAYSPEEKETISIYVDESNIYDIETNIEIGAMDFRNSVEYYNYNIPLGTQSYNFGFGNMDNSLTMCCNIEGLSTDKLKNDQANNVWLDYRSYINAGDPEYIEHVYSYLPDNATITVLDRDGNEHSIQIVNDYTKSKSKQ